MLRIKYSIVILTMLLISSISFAKGTDNNSEVIPVNAVEKELQISVFQNSEDHRYIVSFKNETDEAVQLAMLDENGNQIYSEKVEGKGVYNKRFDLINLVDGEYTVTIGNKFKSIVKDLTIK